MRTSSGSSPPMGRSCLGRSWRLAGPCNQWRGSHRNRFRAAVGGLRRITSYNVCYTKLLRTYNAPAIVAFGEAAVVAERELGEYEEKTRRLRNRLRDGFLAAIPDIRINGHPELVLPNTLNVSFPGAEGEAILLMFAARAGRSVGAGTVSTSLDRSARIPYVSCAESYNFV